MRLRELLEEINERLARIEARHNEITNSLYPAAGLLSIEDVAELAGVPTAAVKRWGREGLLRVDDGWVRLNEMLVFLRARKSARSGTSGKCSRSEEKITQQAKALARGIRDVL